MTHQNPHTRILEAMKDAGVTKPQLAEALGIRLPSVYCIINGNPTVDTLYRVAEALGCSVHDLLT